jgi:hypothetical protein
MGQQNKQNILGDREKNNSRPRGPKQIFVRVSTDPSDNCIQHQRYNWLMMVIMDGHIRDRENIQDRHLLMLIWLFVAHVSIGIITKKDLHKFL